ncbi:GerAB/ArcD/ProY family transporter [Brevibacillus sp. SYSU BS000544]|uniref:GerAB/ArcD/ProY family transporter n=1 Tax=Brevibacillus sp. SYSU BS000544 TaxID=3416443 RepID=UPI003CE59C09
MEKGRISAFQMGVMIFPTILATGILIVPSITAAHAKNDLWLSPIWGSIVGFISVYIICYLGLLFPKQSIIQYSQQIIGKFPGQILGFLYLFFILHINGVIVREYAEFTVGVILPMTPINVVMGAQLLVCSFAVRGGVEVLGRIALVFFPAFMFLFLLVHILLLPDLKPEFLFPVLENGVKPSIMGSIIPAGWFSEVFLIAFLIPFVTDTKRCGKLGGIFICLVMGAMVISNLVILFLFGNTVSTLVYPFMRAASYVSLADFFENLEAVVMTFWIGGLFVKISVFYYANVIGAAQLFQLSDYRPIILPIGFLTLLFSIWGIPRFEDLSHFVTFTGPFYLTFFGTIIPFLLMVIALLRKGISGVGNR